MKKALYLIVTIVCSLAAHSQNTCFTPFDDFHTYYGPYSASGIAAADMNNDGKRDVVISMGDIVLLTGNNDGSFNSPVTYTANGLSGGKLQVADFNSDNKPDIISFDNPPSGTKSLSIYTNNNFTGLTQVLTIATNIQAGNAQSPGRIRVADLDGDNLRDVVVNDYNGNKLFVYKNNGNNTLTLIDSLPTSTKPLNFVLGDLTGDGRAEIVCAYVQATDTVSVFINNGSGTFAPAANIVGGNSSGGIALADFDNDAKADLVVSYSSEMRYRKGNGNGTFASTYSDITIASFANEFIAGDYNNDNRTDIAFFDKLVHLTGVVLGNGNGTFQPRKTYSSYGSAEDMVIANFDADARQDVITLNGVQKNISYLKGQADGTFGPLSLRAGYGPERFAIGLVNSDTFPDIVTANYYDLSISVMPGNGNGSFQASINDTAGGYPHDVALGDVNGDGKTDAILANNGGIVLLSGNGNGTFQTPVIASGVGAGGDRAVALADINNDSKPDIVTSIANEDSMFVLLGNGDGSFQTAVSYATGQRPYDIKLARVNGDNFLDAVVPNDISNDVSVLFGNGDGTFQQALNLAAGAGPRAVDIADFDNDTDADIVCVNNNADNVSVLLNNGNGTFAAAANYPVTTSGSPSTVSAGRFNNDIYPDLIVAQPSKNNVAVLLNNGDGTFGALSTYATDYAPADASFFDFNYDGFTDIASCNGAGSVTVVLNSGVTLSASGTTQLCEGDSVLLMATGGTSYLWSTGATTAAIYANTTGSYSATVTVATQSGDCIAEPVAIPVTVASGPPVVTFNPSNDRFCISDEDLNLSMVGGSPQGGLYSGNNVSNGVFDITAAGSGQHIITYTISNNCGTSFDADTLFIDTEVLASINFPSDTFCNNTGAITLAPYGSPTGGTWGVNNQVVTTVNPGNVGPGTYLLHYAIIAGGCRDTAYVNAVVETCTDINGPENTGINIYPNPGKGNFIIHIENDQKFSYAKLYDTQGRLVYQQKILENNQIQLNTALNAGTYMLQLSGEQKTILKKLIIQ